MKKTFPSALRQKWEREKIIRKLHLKLFHLRSQHKKRTQFLRQSSSKSCSGCGRT